MKQKIINNSLDKDGNKKINNNNKDILNKKISLLKYLQIITI